MLLTAFGGYNTFRGIVKTNMQKSIENNMAKSNRDNFSEKTRRILRERVGGKCSNPSCKRETCGPSDSEDRSLILGEAAHIRAAAPGGPRYDASMSAEERMHISNGIWLCRDCARLIDINASSYSVETLMAWKEEAEKRQRKYLGHRICMSESIDENIYPVYLSDIPPHVIEFYIDRPQLEQKILNKVLANKQCLMTGIGGIGKTETVKKVLQKIQTIESNESGVRYIIWVNFSNNDLRTSILEALPEFQTAQDKKEAWNECWRMFQRYREQLLLVIDNIESGASDPELEKLASFPCRLVVTSRREDIGGLETILVSVLSEEECIRLFNTYYRGEHNQYALSMVLRLIDYHTIMIELLAKTANMEEWGIEELCTQLVNHGFHMSEESVKGHHEKLKDENKLIEQLKKLFSLTSYQDSFKSMLEQVSVVPAIPFRFKDISRWTTIKKKSELEKMVTTGWLQSDYQFRTTYIMHSVVAAAIRSQFEDTLYYDCRNIIVALANDMHYGHDKHGSEKAWMIPFSWSVSDVMRRQLCSEDDAAFLINLAHIYDDIGNFEAAREFYQRAYDIHRSLKSKEVDLSIDMYNLAQFHMSLDQLNKAREYGEKCLELRLNRNETDKQDLLTVYALMGPIYHRLGDMEKAEEFFSKGQVLIQNNHYIDRIVSNTLICDLASFYRDR